MAFAQPRSVRAKKHGQMGKLWHTVAKGFVEEYLLWGVVYVVITPYYVGYLHECVVYDHAEVVSGCAITSKDYEVLYLLVLEGYGATDYILQRGAALWHPEAKRKGAALWRTCKGSAPAVVLWGAAFFQGFFSSLFELFGCTVAPVGKPLFKKPFCMFSVKVEPLALVERAFVPLEPEPAHVLKYGFCVFLFRAFSIGILYAQHELSTIVSCKEVVKEGCSCPSYVQIACWRWCKACSYLHQSYSFTLFLCLRSPPHGRNRRWSGQMWCAL